jgi:hypothetical protein
LKVCGNCHHSHWCQADEQDPLLGWCEEGTELEPHVIPDCEPWSRCSYSPSKWALAGRCGDPAYGVQALDAAREAGR